jgi:hypothetical protein
MWTKRNDHAPKMNVLIFFSHKHKMAVLKSFIILLSCFHLLFSKKTFHLKIIKNIISLPWAPAFFYESTSLASPVAKSVGPCQ